MLVLTSTDSIRVVTTTANALDVFASWADNAAASFAPGDTPTAIAAATTTTVVAAPAASTTRNVSSLSCRAKGGTNGVTVQFFNGTAFEITSVTLGANERLEYENGQGWSVLDSNGARKALTSASPAIATVQNQGVSLTQRPTINAVNGTRVTLTAADDGINNRTNITGELATVAANTVLAEATGAVAIPQAVALAVQQTLIRSAANIVAVTAAANQVLGRTAAGGNLGFIAPPGGLLRAPQVVTAMNAAFAHPTGTTFVVAIGKAGGGGGGGAVNSAAAQITLGAGGACGGHFFHVFATISGTSNVTIGAAGAAGANTGAAAGAGGNTSVVQNAVTVTAIGGPGAPINTTAGMAGVTGATFAASPGALPPAISTNALLNGGGEQGGAGLRFSGTAGPASAAPRRERAITRSVLVVAAAADCLRQLVAR
jgi:hypothetical protein